MYEVLTEINRIFPSASPGSTKRGHVSPDGVIRNVKILGLTSKNGRTYPIEALRRAAKMYEGAKVNIDHAEGDPGKTRGYGDRIGILKNVTVREDGLYGDLRCNPRHALFEQLRWDAENSPGAVGLSHNVLARTTRRGGKVVVEEITKVQSVDLVADPATTQGLFESTGHREQTIVEIIEAIDGPADTAAFLHDRPLFGQRQERRRRLTEVLAQRWTE